MKIYALSLAIGLLIAGGAIAADTGTIPAPEGCKEVQTCGAPNCCAHCGGQACCEKYCRVVCEMKEVKKTVWTVKCEEFCPLLPNCPSHCEEGCESCGAESCSAAASCAGCEKSCNPCASIENRNFTTPKCGKVRTKKTLEKKEIVCKIPSYKCVVSYACGACGTKSDGEKAADPKAPATAPAPAPAPASKSKTTQLAPLPPVVGTSFVR